MGWTRGTGWAAIAVIGPSELDRIVFRSPGPVCYDGCVTRSLAFDPPARWAQPAATPPPRPSCATATGHEHGRSEAAAGVSEADRLHALRRQVRLFAWRLVIRMAADRPGDCRSPPRSCRCGTVGIDILEADLGPGHRQLVVMHPDGTLSTCWSPRGARFPDGVAVFQEGPGRTIRTLPAPSSSSRPRPRLLGRARLDATQFNWLIMSAPLNEAMLLGDESATSTPEGDRLGGRRCPHTFLGAYGVRSPRAGSRPGRGRSTLARRRCGRPGSRTRP